MASNTGRSRRIRNRKTEEEEKPLPKAPDGVEEVTEETVEAVEKEADLDMTASGAETKKPGATNDEPASNSTTEYIDSDGSVTSQKDAEAQSRSKSAESASNQRTGSKGKKFSGGKRYEPSDKRVAAPEGRIVPAGEPLTFDGLDFGTHIVVLEDVFREAISAGSTRPTYILVYRAGTQLARSAYEVVTKSKG